MYTIKLYSKSKVFKNVINLEAIKNKISFTKQINGGLGQFSLLLDMKYGTGNTYDFTHPITGNIINYSFIQGDIIEIYHFYNKIETLIYVGYIEEIIDNIADFQQLELKINGLASLFKRLIYNVGGNYTANINQDTFTTISDIKTFINTYYNYFSIVGSLSGITASYDLNYNNCFDLINNIKNLSTNFYRYLDNYDLIFKEKPTTATHTFTLQKDVVELNIEEDAIDVVNYLILTYKTGTAVYQDATSISTYGRREKYISNTQLANLTSANEFGNNYIAENKNPRQRISLSINNKYLVLLNELLQDMTNNLDTYTDNLENYPLYKSIHTIKPGDSCKIRNINKSFNDNLLIVKINYNQDIITLELEQFENFIGLIKQ